VLDWDPEGVYRFAALQSTPGRELLMRSVGSRFKGHPSLDITRPANLVKYSKNSCGRATYMQSSDSCWKISQFVTSW